MKATNSISNYYPYGMMLPGRHANESDYRYGAANGQEKVDEISGSGNHYTAQYWEYDSRNARRWNIDPVVKYHESPYATFANNPIMFVDVNGADTSNYGNTISQAGYQAATSAISTSPTYNSFFQSFINGGNKDINLEFSAVRNLKAFDSADPDNDDPLDGQVQILYNGQNIYDPSVVIPKEAKLSDFSILVQLRSDMRHSSSDGGTDYTNAMKGVTLAHEMFVHVLSATSLIRSSVNSEGDFDGNLLQQNYISSMSNDHNQLYAGKNTDYIKVANEISQAQSIGKSSYYRGLRGGANAKPDLDGLQSKHGKLYLDQINMRAYFSHRQLWRLVFDVNMKPMPSPVKVN